MTAVEVRHVWDDHDPTRICGVAGCEVAVCDDPACPCSTHDHQGAVRHRQRCTLGWRHWFAYYGMVGSSSPTCVRCGAPNPKYDHERDPLTADTRRRLTRASR